ncbi:hypothetical protein [Cupriavidus sp. YAF13]|uniref:hypothetical protein n=1 Tax=Cupriavidus sp. YAF13 TaxID=3233075 RepID=UPI003F93C5B1
MDNDQVPEYRKTVRWFIASAIALLIGLFGAMLDAAVAGSAPGGPALQPASRPSRMHSAIQETRNTNNRR